MYSFESSSSRRTGIRLCPMMAEMDAICFILYFSNIFRSKGVMTLGGIVEDVAFDAPFPRYPFLFRCIIGGEARE